MAETNGTHAPSPQPQSATQPSQPTATQTPTTSQQTQAMTSMTETTNPTARDDGASTRPRDARTLHLVLNAIGVTAYQERVPLQLLDFAYRYTSGILSDAQHLAAEGYITASDNTTKSGGRARNTNTEDVNLQAVRLATASRLGYQFHGPLPKEAQLEMAAERNKIRLPAVGEMSGVRLPHERFVMGAGGWKIPEEWDSEESEEAEEVKINGAGAAHEEDEEMGETTAEDLLGAAKEEDATMGEG